jgi:phosphatidylglycerol:prolipoprotein diacylglycerol transferase
MQYRLPQFANLPETARFHPAFLYESIWNFLVFVTLMFVARRYGERLLKGDVFLLWLILYPLGRIIVEFQRPDAWMLGPIAAAQAVSVVAIVSAVVILVYRHRTRPSPAESEEIEVGAA